MRLGELTYLTDQIVTFGFSSLELRNKADFNPAAAEKTDELIEAKVENLLEQPLMGVQRDGIRGRLLIIPEISMIVSYWVDGSKIRIMRVLHQKQKFPND